MLRLSVWLACLAATAAPLTAFSPISRAPLRHAHGGSLAGRGQRGWQRSATRLAPLHSLATGWEAQVDQASGQTYYTNSQTGQTQWDPPQSQGGFGQPPAPGGFGQPSAPGGRPGAFGQPSAPGQSSFGQIQQQQQQQGRGGFRGGGFSPGSFQRGQQQRAGQGYMDVKGGGGSYLDAVSTGRGQGQSSRYQPSQARAMNQQSGFGMQNSFGQPGGFGQQQNGGFGQQNQPGRFGQQNQPGRFGQQSGGFGQQNQQGAGASYMQALQDYNPQNQGELGFRAGDYIEVMQPGEQGGWWWGKNNGQEGWFPTPYTQQV